MLHLPGLWSSRASLLHRWAPSVARTLSGRRPAPLGSLAPRAAAASAPLPLRATAFALLVAFGCGTGDATHVEGGVAGNAGQAGNAGNGGNGGNGNGGAGNAAGEGGSAGADGGLPAVCEAPGGSFAWPGVEAPEVPEHPAVKAQLELPFDPFLSQPQGDVSEELRWVKFIALGGEPVQVYFQDAAAYPFHHDFAIERIPGFEGMTRADFDAATLYSEGRRAVLGAVLVPADSASHPEYGVQLVSNDDLPPALVEAVFDGVAARVTAPEGTTGYYFPSGVSAECIDGKAAELAERGVPVGSVDRWLVGDACYAPGWAVGRLVALPAAEIDAAYLDGRLAPEDILSITDTAPAELPFVAGIVTLAPSTPNAHAAILARSYAVPFAYLRDPAVVAQAEALAGKLVVLSTRAAAGRDPFDLYFGDCDLRLIDAERLSQAELGELRALAAPPAIEVAPKRAAGALTLHADDLVPADIDRVGGKAAHFGLLRAVAPEQTPRPALALTFDLWDAFLAQPAPGGAAGTLGDEIARRLEPHAWPADLRALDAALEGVRDLIEDAPFPAEARASLIEALAGFDADRRIRFRSSTNVEDSETFTGAGLYDSATGCLADDLDADGFGPSLCNAAEPEERGVLRAIRRVYASFYFRNAYFERLRRGVNEADAAMGVLVHYSVPDPEELANGVATLTVEGPSRHAELVTQAGAVSVTNPEGDALPEEVRVERYEAEDYLTTLATSTLLPLGAHVLDHEGEYRTLMTLFNQVADEYASVTGKASPFALDFEYKKIAPGELSLRQVRPLPLASSARDVTPFFLGAPETLCVYGSERADALAAHRLKARIALTGASAWLTPERLGETLYTNARVDFVSGAATAALEGAPASLPGASHALEQSGEEATLLDRWTAAGATWTLRSRFTAAAARGESPVLTPADFFFDLTATWDSPVPSLEYSFETNTFAAATRAEESVELWGACPEAIGATDALPRVSREFGGSGGLQIATSYWYPPPPRGFTAGYTAPVLAWDRTTIEGLTTAPIVLRGYFSQTHAPYHHNFGGQYVFEPRLDPDVSAAALAELEAADVARIIVIDQDGLQDEIWVMGAAGELRKL